MCGIMGIFSFEKFGNKPIKEIVVKMLLDIEERGKDATGISLIDTEKNRIKVIKTNISATKFKSIVEGLDYSSYNLILGHTRFKTQGTEKKNINNHPFYNKKFKNCLIHNGQVFNYTELKNQFKLKLEGECDSEVILSLFNNRHSIKKTIKNLNGSFAFGLYSNRKLYLYKNSNPLFSCYSEEENLYLFSSHEEIFNKVFGSQNKKKFGLFVKNSGLYFKEFEDSDLMTIDFKKKNIFLKQIETKEEKTFCDYGESGFNATVFNSDYDFVFKTEELSNNKRKREQFIKDRLFNQFGILEEDLYNLGYTLEDSAYLTNEDIELILKNCKGVGLENDIRNWET